MAWTLRPPWLSRQVSTVQKTSGIGTSTEVFPNYWPTHLSNQSKNYLVIFYVTSFFVDPTLSRPQSDFLYLRCTLWFQLEDNQSNPINRHTYKGICNRCWVVFIRGAPKSASKLGIDPIYSPASYFGKSTGSNKRSVPINRTVSSNRNQRVPTLFLSNKGKQL